MLDKKPPRLSQRFPREIIRVIISSNHKIKNSSLMIHMDFVKSGFCFMSEKSAIDSKYQSES
jgi:hypothetical protein